MLSRHSKSQIGYFRFSGGVVSSWQAHCRLLRWRRMHFVRRTGSLRHVLICRGIVRGISMTPRRANISISLVYLSTNTGRLSYSHQCQRCRVIWHSVCHHTHVSVLPCTIIRHDPFPASGLLSWSSHYNECSRNLEG